MRTLSAQPSFAAARAALMPDAVPSTCGHPFQAVGNDFISHPERFPLSVRRTALWPRRRGVPPARKRGDLGLSFRSSKHIAIGTEIEISIPLRGDVQKFRGTVVLVRGLPIGYEIGLWLETEDDVIRARIVEQICHLECYLDDRRQHDRRPPRDKGPVRTWSDQLLRPLAS